MQGIVRGCYGKQESLRKDQTVFLRCVTKFLRCDAFGYSSNRPKVHPIPHKWGGADTSDGDGDWLCCKCYIYCSRGYLLVWNRLSKQGFIFCLGAVNDIRKPMPKSSMLIH